MRKAVYLAIFALASCSAFAGLSPLPPDQAAYLEKKFEGYWSAPHRDGSISATIDYADNYLTFLLDDGEAVNAKVIDVDMARNIVAIEFLTTKESQGVITLALQPNGKLLLDVMGSSMLMNYTRRLTQFDRDRIECLTAPQQQLDMPEVAKRCEAMGLSG